MDFKEKIEYANKVAKELQEQKKPEEIMNTLKSEGVNEWDITNILERANKIIEENFSSKIREFLIADKKILDAPEFNSLDREMLKSLIQNERQDLRLAERNKIINMFKESSNRKEILAQVDSRFLSIEKATEQITNLEEIKEQTSGIGRWLNVGFGIVLLAVAFVMYAFADRLFYALPIFGVVFIFKGLASKRISYED